MKKTTMMLAAGAALVVAKGLDNRLEVTHYTASSDKIPPEFDGFKILLLADLHCDKTAGIAEAVRQENPDIICCPGDMTHDDVPYEPFISLLKKLVNIAPTYITSGNHDVWRTDFEELVKVCKDTGAIFLRNERTTIEKNGEKIIISGIEDPNCTSYNGIRESMASALDKLPEQDGYEILLFHRANLLDMLVSKGFDLILSGHMHGGQIRIPGMGGLMCPKTNIHDKTGIIFPKYFGGEYNREGTKMIVTRGIGNKTIIPRLFNRPEICTITLKNKNN